MTGEQEYIEKYKKIEGQLNKLHKRKDRLYSKQSNISGKMYDLEEDYLTDNFCSGSTISLQRFSEGKVTYKRSNINAHSSPENRTNLDQSTVKVTVEIEVPYSKSFKEKMNKLLDELDEINAEYDDICKKIDKLDDKRIVLLTDYAADHGKFKIGTQFRFIDGVTHTVTGAIAKRIRSSSLHPLFTIEYTTSCPAMDVRAHGIYDTMEENSLIEKLDTPTVEVVGPEEKGWRLPARALVDDIKFDASKDRAVIKTKQSIYILMSVFNTPTRPFSEFLADFYADPEGAQLMFKRGKYNATLFYKNNTRKVSKGSVMEAYGSKEEYVARNI